MRELIRPTLFVVAKVGLSLVVILWGVSQYWSTRTYVSIFVVHTCEFGLAVQFRPRLDLGRYYHTSIVHRTHGKIDKLSPSRWSFGLVKPSPYHPSTKPQAYLFSGIATHKLHGGIGHMIAIRHWLIITIFALFYGVLKWVYRKRGTEVADGE